MAVTNFDMVQANAFLGADWMTQGKRFYVKPYTGSDGNVGTSPSKALKTLAKALSLATAGQNDIVYLFSESNTASLTTDYQSSTLTWNKDMVHLIGVSAGGPVAQRARVALISTYVTASNLFTLSANGCRIEGVHFYEGVADANPTGCMQVTGTRNLIRNCHIAGIGNNANDIAGAYSLKLTGSENLFDDCTIGLDTIARGTAANSGLLLDTAASRNEFRGCRFVAQLEHATNHVHVRFADATAIDRYLLFKDCWFYYMSANYATAGTGVCKLTATLTQGYPVFINCCAQSDAPGTAIKWDVDDGNQIWLFNSPTPAADTAGVPRLV